VKQHDQSGTEHCDRQRTIRRLGRGESASQDARTNPLDRSQQSPFATDNRTNMLLAGEEQKLLTTLRGFKEAKLHPGWSTPVVEAWDEFLVRLVRRLSDSGLFGRGTER